MTVVFTDDFSTNYATPSWGPNWLVRHNTQSVRVTSGQGIIASDSTASAAYYGYASAQTTEYRFAEYQVDAGLVSGSGAVVVMHAPASEVDPFANKPTLTIKSGVYVRWTTSHLAPYYGKARLMHVSGGVATELHEGATDISGIQSVRLRVWGNTISYKVWQQGTTEPTEWDWTGTIEGAMPPGKMVLAREYSSRYNSGDARFDNLIVDADPSKNTTVYDPVEIVGSARGGTTGFATSTSVTLPPGIEDGDMAFIVCNGSVTGAYSSAQLPLVSLSGILATSTYFFTTVYSAQLSASHSGQTVVFTHTNRRATIGIVVVRNIRPNWIMSELQNSSTSLTTSGVVPGVYAFAGGATSVALVATRATANHGTEIAGWTELEDGPAQTGSPYHGVGIHVYHHADVGEEGFLPEATVTNTVTANRNIYRLALIPAGLPTPFFRGWGLPAF